MNGNESFPHQVQTGKLLLKSNWKQDVLERQLRLLQESLLVISDQTVVQKSSTNYKVLLPSQRGGFHLIVL